MKSKIIVLVLTILCISCTSRQSTKPITTVNTPPETPETMVIAEPEIRETPAIEEDFTALQFNVALGISPQRPRWVLFKNGTYIIFPEGYTDAQIKDKAIEMVGNYANETITYRKSSLAKGWIGATSKGIYTYISQDDVVAGITDELTIKAQAVQNIQADQRELRVIHINNKKN